MIVSQLRPNNTAFNTLYHVSNPVRAQRKLGRLGEGVIRVTNSTDQDLSFRLCVNDGRDDDYDENTALFWDEPIPMNEERTFPMPSLTSPNSRIGVASAFFAFGLTFTLEETD